MSGPPPRSILITGASSGIGRALARLYAAPGVRLAISGRNRQRLQDVALGCRDSGAEVSAECVDVTDAAAMNAWIARHDAVRPLDLVIANAGISGGGGGGGEDANQTRNVFAVNLAGVLNTVLPVLGPMRRRGGGQIAIISSIAGYRGFPMAPAYSASKAAVKAWGEGLRGWLADDGVRVSVVCPGYVKTNMTANNRFPMPFLMDPGKAAEIIQKNLAKNKGRITFPWPMAFGVWLSVVLPAGLVETILKRLPKKE